MSLYRLFNISFSRTVLGSIRLCCALLLAGPTASAQSATTGSISGTVTDPTGAVVKGATVTLTNTNRNEIIRTLTTNSAGYYTGTYLPLGNYVVKIASSGFKSEAITDLVLNADDALTVNRTLVP